ncbi:MAG: IclR family transcriptional regulator [Solirubrobacteraceae bacterium]
MTSSRNQSLVRGVALLKALAENPIGMSVASLSEVTGLPRSTTARLLATLEDLDVAARVADGWIVGSEVVRLGSLGDPFGALRDRSREHLARLSAEVAESAMITVVHSNWDTETIVQVDAENLVGATNWLGVRHGGVLHASAVGKLALATLSDADLRAWTREGLKRFTNRTLTDDATLVRHLEIVRRQRFATTVDELEVGLTAVAVPLTHAFTLRRSSARALSVSVSGPSSRVTPDRFQAMVEACSRVALELSRVSSD